MEDIQINNNVAVTYYFSAIMLWLQFLLLSFSP